MINKVLIILFIINLPALIANAESYVTQNAQEGLDYYSTGDYDNAIKYFEEIYTQLRKNKTSINLYNRLIISLYIGLSYEELGEYTLAKEWYLNTLQLAKKNKYTKKIPKLLNKLAETERILGNSSDAVKLYNEILTYKEINDKEKGVIYYNIAESYLLEDNYKKAIEYCNKSKEIALNYNIARLELVCGVVDADIMRSEGKYTLALRVLGEIYDRARAKGYSDIMVSSLNVHGIVSEKLGRRSLARNNFEEALSISIRNNNYDKVDGFILKIISLLPEKGKFVECGDEFKELATLSENHNDRYKKYLLWRLAANYYGISGKYEESLLMNENSFIEALNEGLEQEVISALYNMSQNLFLMKDYENTIAQANEAIDKSKDSNIEDFLSRLYYLKGESLLKLKKYNEATTSLYEAIEYETNDNILLMYNNRIKEIIDYQTTETLKITDDNIKKYKDNFETSRSEYKTFR